MARHNLTKQLLTEHKAIIENDIMYVIGTYLLDHNLQRTDIEFLLKLRTIYKLVPSASLSEAKLAEVFNISESQIQRTKAKLNTLGYLSWCSETSRASKYYLSLNSSIRDELIKLINVPTPSSLRGSLGIHKTQTKQAIDLEILGFLLKSESTNNGSHGIVSLRLGQESEKESKKRIRIQTLNEGTDFNSSFKVNSQAPKGLIYDPPPITSKPTTLANNILKHWNSKTHTPSHLQVGTKVRNKAIKVLEEVFNFDLYKYQDIIDAVDNYEYILSNPDKFWVTKPPKLSLVDFIRPGYLSSYYSAEKKPVLWLEVCMNQNLPMERFRKGTVKPKCSELASILLQKSKSFHGKHVFNLNKQLDSLELVAERLSSLTLKQPSNGVGVNFTVVFDKVTGECLKAADEYFGTWRNIDRYGITPTMLAHPKFWKEGFPEYEHQNRPVGGIVFPTEVLASY